MRYGSDDDNRVESIVLTMINQKVCHTLIGVKFGPVSLHYGIIILIDLDFEASPC